MYKNFGIFVLFIIASLGGFSFGQYIADAATTVTADKPSFQANLTSTLDLQAGIGKPTFTRADGADRVATVTDFEGLIRPVKAGEARFEGARRVENLVPSSENLSGWAVSSGATFVTGATDPLGGNTAYTFSGGGAGGYVYGSFPGNLTVGKSYINSVWIKRISGTGDVRLRDVNNGTNTIMPIATDWKRFSIPAVAHSGGVANLVVAIDSAGDSVAVWGAQTEDVTGQANQNPSEYVSTNVKTSAPYHGANVDGVKYFATQNGNTVSSNVVTEATGSAIPDATLKGYVAEGSRTNLLMYSEEFDNVAVAWTNEGNITVEPNAAVSPNGTLTADNLNATAGANARISEYLSCSGSTEYTLSVYVKKNTSSVGRIELNSSGGADPANGTDEFINFDTGAFNTAQNPNTTTRSLTSVGNGWYRVTMSYVTSSTHTAIGVILYGGPHFATAGQTYYWGAQLEQASFASSYIPTTTASVTRAADVLSYPTSGNIGMTAGTMYAETLVKQIDTYSGIVGISTAGGSNVAQIFGTSVNIRYEAYDGATQANILNLTRSVDTATKVAARYATNSFRYAAQGTLSDEDVSGAIPNFSGAVVEVGLINGTIYQTFGTVRNVKIWKKALTDTQLTNLTSTTAAVSQSAVKKTTVNASQNTKLTTGLVGLWSFNGTDISGTTAYDRSGQNNNGTLTNGPVKTIGKVGQALSFDGVDDYVDTGSTFSTLTSAFSTSIWVRPNASQVQYADIIGNHAGGGITGIVIERDATISDQYYFSYGDGASWVVTNNFTLAANAWHHVVAVKNAAGATVYVDGVSVASAVSATNINPSTNTVKIGNSIPGIRYWNGKIDEVRIYNRALSATEVKQLYNLGR